MNPNGWRKAQKTFLQPLNPAISIDYIPTLAMIRINENYVNAEEKQKNILAPHCTGMLEFRRYTIRVWSKVAGRLITEKEADQIIEDFGRFLHILAGEDGE